MPVSRLPEVSFPQGMLTPPQDPTILLRHLYSRLQVNCTKTHEALGKAIDENHIPSEVELRKAAILLDALGAIQAPDYHNNKNSFYSKNKLVVPEGYQPIESFGSRTFINTPYDSLDDYKKAELTNGHVLKIEQGLKQKGLLNPDEQLIRDNHRLYEDTVQKGTNIAPNGMINHPTTGLQAGAFINHDSKTVLLGFAGFNFDKGELVEAFIKGGTSQYARVKEEVELLLKSKDIPEGYDITLTGHSMGSTITQRLIYDIKNNQELAKLPVRAINFDALPIAGSIPNYNPDIVMAEECINLNASDRISKYGRGNYGGGHVGGGYYKMEANMHTGMETVDGNTDSPSSIQFVNDVKNHRMIHMAEGLFREHVINSKKLKFVSTRVEMKQEQEKDVYVKQEPEMSRTS